MQENVKRLSVSNVNLLLLDILLFSYHKWGHWKEKRTVPPHKVNKSWIKMW